MITEPGPIKALSEKKEKTIVESIKKCVEISVSLHQSELVALVGHHDCAGNPVDQDTQEKQIRMAADVVESWKFNVRKVGLWVDKNLSVHEVPLSLG
jgi:carbonic anhydrase